MRKKILEGKKNYKPILLMKIYTEQYFKFNNRCKDNTAWPQEIYPLVESILKLGCFMFLNVNIFKNQAK